MKYECNIFAQYLLITFNNKEGSAKTAVKKHKNAEISHHHSRKNKNTSMPVSQYNEEALWQYTRNNTYGYANIYYI